MVDFDKMYAGSWYTITGTGGDIQEWKDGYQNLLRQANIGTVVEWVEFTGAEINAYYGLTDSNAYPDKIHFLAFPLENLNISKLAMFKLQMQDRWFDDIVANNAARQKEINKRKETR